MAEVLKETPKTHSQLFVPEDHILQYMKAAKEEGLDLKIVKKPGETVDIINEYVELKNEYFVDVSTRAKSSFTSFFERVNQLISQA